MALDLSRIYGKKIAVHITNAEDKLEFVNAIKEQYPNELGHGALQHYVRYEYFRLSDLQRRGEKKFGYASSSRTYTDSGFTIVEFDYLIADDDAEMEEVSNDDILEFLKLGGDY